ncbi:hypothetical protein U9M48_013291 [Paspalum notatum var. saurae]|uniref:Uncharacterized protein n=1 Tax=Paspalum notatum var. saurae TaxID=547442 RepID=A0AAQ3SZ55_PASNO
MSWAALARKLTRISQSHAPPAFVGGLLYCSYGSGSSGSHKRSLPWRVMSIGAISLAGGLVLSAVNDLAIFNGCTIKAIEQATDSTKVVEAIGVPIVRGPWYDASLVVKAIRNGEDGLLSFLRHHDWVILTMEAHLHLSSDDEDQKALVKEIVVSNDRGIWGTRE